MLQKSNTLWFFLHLFDLSNILIWELDPDLGELHQCRIASRLEQYCQITTTPPPKGRRSELEAGADLPSSSFSVLLLPSV